MVSAFDAVAVTVMEPPRLTELPLIVTAEFVNCAFVTVPESLVVARDVIQLGSA